MVSLIEQLQSDALDRAMPITDLLRKAKTAAVKLKRSDLTEWLEHELSGYGGADIPEYRVLPAEMKFFNPMHGWCPIVGRSPHFSCRQPMSEVLSLLESDDTRFVIPVGHEIVQHFSKKVGFLVDVKQHVSRASLAGIVDAVRNAVLDWALKLEEVGVCGEGLSFSKAETDKAQGVTIHIGNIGNAVGIGSFGDHAAIRAVQGVVGDDLVSAVRMLVDQVERALPRSDLPAETRFGATEALAELREAANEPTPEPGRLRRGLETLKRVMENAAGDVVAAGVLALIGQIHPAL